MSEIPRQTRFEIVPDLPDAGTEQEHDSGPKGIFELLEPFMPDDFHGKYQITIHGVIIDSDDDTGSRKLNITFFNSENQHGQRHRLAKLAFRDKAMPEHGMDVFVVERVRVSSNDDFDDYRLREPVRQPVPSQKKSFKNNGYTDCSPPVIDLVSGWLCSFHEIEDVRAI